MSEYLEKIVYLSQADYNTVLNGGSVTRNGITLSELNDNYLYITDGTISATDIGGILPISKGGTNANNVEDARTNLGLGDAALKSVTSTISTSTSLPTAAAVKTYVDSTESDQNVIQQYKTASGYTYWRPLLVSAHNSQTRTGFNPTSSPDKIDGTFVFNTIMCQPSTGTIHATFEGSGASLTNLNASNISAGTLAVARGGTGVATANAHAVFAGPTSGDAAAPSFRGLDASDIPNITRSKITDLGTAAGYNVTNNGSNADVTSTDENLITARTLYYQLAKKGYTTNTGTVTSVSTGAGLTGGAITGSGTIKANLTSDTQLTGAALTVTEDANRIYPVRVDKNGKLVVVVPWSNTNSGYITNTGSAGDILYWNGSNSTAHLTKGSNGQFLKLASGLPSWASITSSDVSGLGTMATASADSYIPKSAYNDAYQIMYSTGSGAYALLTANKSTTKKFLSMTGASSSTGAAPVWTTLAKGDVGLGNVDNKSSATIRSEITSSNVTTALGFTPLNAALKGANSGVAELDETGHVPTSQLPSYVDDVLEYTTSNFPTTGETGIIYVNTTTNKTYRWSGTQMVEISPSIALGTTSETAFRGDYGQAAYTHAVTNKGAAFTSGLYKITTNAEGHVTAATAVVAADIPGLSSYIPKSTLSGAFDIMYSSQANTPTRLAANTSSTRKYLSMKGTGSTGAAPTWEAITASDVGAAASSHTHGNIQNGGTLQTTDVTIGSGDKLVITDSSDSNKVARASLAFSASVSSQSQTTKFLREDGTWAAPSYTTNTNNAVTHTLATTTKYYVTGTTSATTSTGGDSFDTGVYVTTNAGEFSAVRLSYNTSGTQKAYTTYNTTDNCIDFIFV